MWPFNLFRKKSIEPEVDPDRVEYELPSEVQLEFSDKVLEVFLPFLRGYGFNLVFAKVDQYFTKIIFRKNTQYLEINGSTFPTDSPWSYGIRLGDGEHEFLESDWNAISLWRMEELVDGNSNYENDFPYGDQIIPSLNAAKEILIRCAESFLRGDLDLFIKVRKMHNQSREPYRISSVGKGGKREISFEEMSVQMKKKYS